ncbi:hypothetical protein AN641_08925 [Candidatus Epulonipiscioides gigas]|nr:hypothetical protein AN641_08925 [Epulopiscium sp. SCG-C07WGA-EpuloA2]
MGKINLKSTKQEIMDEVIRLQDELKELRKAKTTVSDTQAVKVKEEKLEKAQKIIDMNILNPEIIKQFNDVNFAIEEAKKELADIQEVTDALIDAEAIIMAKDNILKEKEKIELDKIEELKTEISNITEDKKQKITDLEKEYADKKTNLEKERKREAEEFNYNLDRARKIDNDNWEEEKTARLKVITTREDEVAKREQKMTEQETEVKELKEKVEGIKELVEKAKEEAFDKAKKKFDKEKAIETNSIKKNAEWEIKVANIEKDRAIEDLAKSQLEIERLQQKLEEAYNSMNTLATTTVKSTGGVKVLEVGHNNKEK